MVPFDGENGGGVKIQLKFDAFTATPEAVTAATIKKSKINYRPGAEIKTVLNTLQYEKMES